ncbi:protein GLUTAMINE DUMPER 5-like [Sesamum indicum]|uniref:Protein GLUTAMINE DUMPER 5-like n=1 Tax=Sesamum indicum TaxID=4182 RepID=A0A6I9TBC7_SESIN|nr:protein GLUTAMINE DUMPER 5-like [Sesamum indicum]
MRTGGALFHSIPVSKTTTAEATATAKATFTPPATIQRSPWHSPVPYLFGGLAAMLGLIAFALLILACSYWKLSGGEEGGQGDVESGAGEKGESNADAKALPVFQEKVLVIMAGDVKPTFLATPMSSRGYSSSTNDETVEGKQTAKEENINQKDETVDENGSAESQVSQQQSH